MYNNEPNYEAGQSKTTATGYGLGRVGDTLVNERVETEISRELESLSRVAGELSEVADAVAERFLPVLRPVPPAKESSNPEQLQNTQVGQMIAESRRRIENNIFILKDVLNRREV